MQARLKTLPVFLVGLATMLLLSACGGGDTGSTWFNVPSVPVQVEEDGSASLYGFNLGPVVDAAMVDQLQAAGVDKLDVRVGYEGIQPYLDGEALPYVGWDQGSVENLQEIVETAPNIPNAGLISRALPMLRTFGLGAALKLPGGENIPNWDGTESTVDPAAAGEVAIGPMEIGGLAFDDQGAASFAGIPLAALGADVALPPALLATLNQLGVDKLTIDTDPSGVTLGYNDKTLPGLKFSEESLGRMLGVAGAFVDDETRATLEQIAPILTASDINLDVSLTGEPAGETTLGKVPVTIQDDGNLAVFGLPVTTEPVIDAATLGQLQEANIQQLDVAVGEAGLNLAANGVKLPSISWTDESLETLAGIVAPMAGIDPGLIDSALGIARNSGLSASVAVPMASGAEAIEVPEDIDFTFAPPEMGDLSAPLIRLEATLGSDGSLVEAAGLDAATLAALGVSGPMVPAETMATLAALGASEIKIVGEPNNLKLLLDGNEALSIAHDAESLSAALDLATAFQSDSPLADPALNALLKDVVLPLIPGSNLDVTINLQ